MEHDVVSVGEDHTASSLYLEDGMLDRQSKITSVLPAITASPQCTELEVHQALPQYMEST